MEQFKGQRLQSKDRLRNTQLRPILKCSTHYTRIYYAARTYNKIILAGENRSMMLADSI